MAEYWTSGQIDSWHIINRTIHFTYSMLCIVNSYCPGAVTGIILDILGRFTHYEQFLDGHLEGEVQ